jgi:hypothetical protein
MWIAAHRTLTRLAELGESAGVTFTLENLNTAVDHPGVPFAKAADTLALVAAVDRPGPADEPRPLPRADRRGEPRRTGPPGPRLGLIGEIQVADVPGRQRAGHRGDQLPGRRERPRRPRLRGHRRHGGMGLQRQRPRPGAVPLGLHALTLHALTTPQSLRRPHSTAPPFHTCPPCDCPPAHRPPADVRRTRMTTPQPLAVGLVGAGRMGSFHAETLARRLPGVRLAAVADPAPGAAPGWRTGSAVPRRTPRSANSSPTRGSRRW